MTRQPYEAPVLTKIGTVHELTLASNKTGFGADIYSTAQNGLVGQIVPAAS